MSEQAKGNKQLTSNDNNNRQTKKLKIQLLATDWKKEWMEIKCFLFQAAEWK